jgi:hypothetical protein
MPSNLVQASVLTVVSQLDILDRIFFGIIWNIFLVLLDAYDPLASRCPIAVESRVSRRDYPCLRSKQGQAVGVEPLSEGTSPLVQFPTSTLGFSTRLPDGPCCDPYTILRSQRGSHQASRLQRELSSVLAPSLVLGILLASASYLLQA